MKPKSLVMYSPFEEGEKTPEHLLWLSVIDRAMMDYIGKAAGISKPSQKEIHDFFFDDTPRPHNLVYICEELFDFPDAVPMIRKRVVELEQLWSNRDQSIRTNNYYAISNSRRRAG